MRNDFETPRVTAKYVINPATESVESVEYLWPGNASAAYLFLRPGDSYEPGTILSVGLLRLRVIDYDLRTYSVLVMRDNWLAFAYQYRHALFVGIERFYHRLLFTAAVWGLASWSQDTIPTWCNLHLAQRLLGLVERVKHVRLGN